MPRSLVVFAVLAVTQTVSWGVVGILPVLASEIAAELGIALPTVFFGTSAMFVAMGLAAPLAGRGFRRYGARRVMAAGAALIGGGLCALGLAPSTVVFLAAWGMIGAAGAMLLTTAAYVYLADFADARARGMIASLMLVTGLAGSLFWPVTAFLDQAIGWRGTAFAYAGCMLALICPLLLAALPETARGPGAARAEASPAARRSPVFWLVVIAVALNSFVTFGFEALGIELFRALGADMALAVGIASVMGVFKVGGRIIDLLGGRRWDGLATAVVSGAMMPLGLLALWLGGASLWAIALFLLLFGIGSGAFAVARATMPLVFYCKADYAAAMSTIALPLNLMSAIAPPCLAALLTAGGPGAVLGSLAALGGAALLVLMRLRRLRESLPPAAPAR